MKTAKFFSLLILLSFFLGINSCKKDEEVEPLCTPTSEYYFIANVGNEAECWNVGENNFTFFESYGVINDSNNQALSYSYVFGISELPQPVSHKGIGINWPVQYNVHDCTKEQFLQTFQTGNYPFNELTPYYYGVFVRYSENDNQFSTGYGDQTGSYINCIDVSEVDTASSTSAVIVTYSIDCKLYSDDGSFYKEIKNATLRMKIEQLEE